MPIRNQIQSIVQTLAEQPTFIYGTVNELNNLADDVSTFPCVFLYPLQPISVSPHINGSVDNSFSIYLEFLYKTERRRIPAGMVLSKRYKAAA